MGLSPWRAPSPSSRWSRCDARVAGALLIGAAVLSAAGALGGCIQRFDTPSAYESEQYLCDDAEALAQRVAECRASGCAGVLSVRGRLQGTDIVATSRIVDAEFTHGHTPDGALRLARIDASGATPYFFLRLAMKSLGGTAGDVVDPTPRVLVFDGSDEADLEDDRALPSMRISNGAESIDLDGLTESGDVRVTAQSGRELAGSFDGSFRTADDRVEGCFHLLATSVRVML